MGIRSRTDVEYLRIYVYSILRGQNEGWVHACFGMGGHLLK